MKKIINNIYKKLSTNPKKIVFIESITGGKVSAEFVKKSGASNYLIASLVAYANEAKINIAKIDKSIIINHGAVSKECALAMAKNWLLQNKADIAISTTGIAGPLGATNEKKIGLVYFGVAKKVKNINQENNHNDFIIETSFEKCQFTDQSRKEIIKKATIKALSLLAENID